MSWYVGWYFDASEKVVQINAVSTLPGRTHFEFTKLKEAALVFPPSALADMNERGRLVPVTLESLVNQGLERFGWLNPSEVLDGVDAEDAKRHWGMQHF